MSQSGVYNGGGGTTTVTKLTGNVGGAVGPTSGNINVVGTGAVAVTGTPGTSTLTISVSGSTAGSFPTDAGTAVPAAGALTVTGGTNIGTTGAGSTVTVNLDTAVSGLSSVDMATGGRFGTSTNNGNTALLQAYDTGAASYTTFATLTANAVPTMDLADSVTKSGNYIYRVGGTDVAITDGGTGLSTTPTNGQILIGNTGTNSYNLGTITAGNGISIANAAGSITASITNGTNGQLLIGGGTGATWASPTSTGGSIAITGGANTLNFETGGTVLTRFSTDAGIATPALGNVNMLGGDNIHSSASGSSVTFDLDTNLTAMGSITTNSGGSLRTGTTAGNTTILAAYNNTSSTYTTFATLTANLVPTFDLASATTIGSAYIYRAGGTDVAIADGGTGISTIPTDGQILIGKTATNDYNLTTLTPGSGIGIANGSGTITISAGATVPTTFAADSGTATPALNSITIAGGTNITTSAAGSTVTANLDADLVSISSITTSAGGSLRTGTSAGNTTLLEAYDVDGTTYIPFATLTANNTPTMDLASGVTIGSSYIYRAGGTDVAITDGGTGLSTTPTDGQLLIGNTGTNSYSLATLTQGANITITNAAGAITIAAGAGGITWSEVTDAAFTIAADNGYICNRGTLVTATLPATCALGKTFRLAGKGAGLWTIAQNAGQTIHHGPYATTVGVGGSLTPLNQYDCIEILCTVADTTFTVISSTGNFTIV